MREPSRQGRRSRVSLAACLVILVAFAVLPGRGVSQAGSCFGLSATTTGSAGFDGITGTDGPDIIDGLGGDDVINAAAGNDRICGGDGNDFMLGSAGDDQLRGGRGRDTMSGGTGTDIVNYSGQSTPVSVRLDGTANDGASGEGDNVPDDVENVLGGSGDDSLVGSGAANGLTGANGDDFLAGGGGPDLFSGGSGADVLQLSDGVRDARADCGADRDQASIDLRDAGQVEPVSGSIPVVDCEEVTIAAVNEGPNVRISSRRVRLSSSGAARVRLRCPRSLSSPCAGRLRLRSVRRVRVGGQRRIARLGSRRYRISPGRTKAVRLRLSRRNRRLMAQLGRLQVEGRAVERGRFGPKTTITRFVLVASRQG